MPTGDMIVTLSPTLRSKLKLSSLPIDIKFFVNLFVIDYIFKINILTSFFNIYFNLFIFYYEKFYIFFMLIIII